LRQVFVLKGGDGKRLLDHWLAWARRCRIPAFVHLAQRIAKRRISINASLEHRLSNGLVESTNTKARLLTRMAFGFKSPEAMIALAMLNLGGYCPRCQAAAPQREHPRRSERRLVVPRCSRSDEASSKSRGSPRALSPWAASIGAG
jgi:transposase